LGITSLRRRHALAEIAVVDDRVPTELEIAQSEARSVRDQAADAVTAYKAENEAWETFVDDARSELDTLELEAQIAEDALTDATNAAEDERLSFDAEIEAETEISTKSQQSKRKAK
jgi:hypothetical protein